MSKYYEVFRKSDDEVVATYVETYTIPTYLGLDADAHGVRPMRYPNWKEQVAYEFRAKRRLAPPWDLDPIADHFAHIVDHPETGATLIAFFASEAHGLIMRTTTLTAGRYAARFYSHLTSDEVRDYATAIDKAGEVQFATTPDDIQAVYENGPNSCMSHKAHEYSSECHPVRVYGAGDLAIAYLGNVETGVSARVLCWPDRKRYCRIYGDEHRLAPALEKLGFSRGRMQGARLLRIEEGSGFVAPYIDGISEVEDDGSHLIITSGGDISCQQTNGFSDEVAQHYCERCEESYRDDDDFSRVRVGTRSYSFESWCECCVENHTFYCDGAHEHVSDNLESIEVVDRNETWSQHYAMDNGFTCEGNGDFYSDDAPSFFLEDTSETVSKDHFDDAECWTDPDTGLHYSEAQASDDDDDAEVIQPRPRSDHPDQMNFDDALVAEPVAHSEAA